MAVKISSLTMENNAAAGAAIGVLTVRDLSGNVIQSLALSRVFNMIKTLFFLAALLAPGLAFGGNPSADLSVQVVPAGSDLPPSGLTPPPGAVAAGYTTLAWEFDIPNNQVCNSASGTLVCVAASPLSNWLDCSVNGGQAATTPMFWVVKQYYNAAPCSDMTIVYDSAAGKNQVGANVLDVAFTPTDYANNIWGTQLETVRQDLLASIEFPPGIYVEVTFAVEPATQTSSYPQLPLTVDGTTYTYGETTDQFFYANNGTTAAFSERDIIELASPVIGGNGGGGPDNNGASGGTGNDYASYNTSTISGYDPTTYNTYADRWFFDGGASVGVCQYITQVSLGRNPVQLHCGLSTSYSGGAALTTRQFAILQVGPQAQTIGSPGIPMHVRFMSYRVWSCAGWATGSCYNSTAAVQGALQGAP
jgi:hypothetical protein